MREMKEKNREPELDWNKILYCKQQAVEVLAVVKSYLIKSIRGVHQSNNLSLLDFYEDLIEKTPKLRGPGLEEPILHPTNWGKADQSLYKKLDAQATLKYLNYPKKNNSNHYFYDEFFSDETEIAQYHQNLSKGIHIRNKYAHDSDSAPVAETSQEYEQDMKQVLDLLKPLMQKPQFGPDELEALQNKVENIMSKIVKMRYPPVKLTDFAAYLYEKEEADISQDQWNVFFHWLKESDLKYQHGEGHQGTVYFVDISQSLQEEGATHRFLSQYLQQKAQVSPLPRREEPAREKREKQAPPRFNNQKIKAIAEGQRLGREMAIWTQLTKSAICIIDETIVLSPQGQIWLTTVLKDACLHSKTKMYMDKASYFSLIQQSQKCQKYTDYELSIYSESQKARRIARREEQRENLKSAFRSIKFLQKHNLLTINESLVPDRNSEATLRHLLTKGISSFCLLFTQNKHLVESLEKAKVNHVLACKIQATGDTVLFYSSSRKALFQDPAYFQQIDRESVPTGIPEQCSPPESLTEGQSTLSPPIPVTFPEDKGNASLQKETDMPIPKTGDVLSTSGEGQATILLGTELAQGGEGKIYRCQDPNIVAKIYFPQYCNHERREKVQYMLEHDPGIQGLTWPLFPLYFQGTWVGFTMKQVHGLELASTVFQPGRACKNITAQGWERIDLVAIALNICRIFQEMHQKGLHMGDINPRNFLVNAQCQVWFVDCDSYQMGPYDCPVGTILYTPPEVHVYMAKKKEINYHFPRTEQQELFSLAVLLFGILMIGRAPYESCNNNAEDITAAMIAKQFPYSLSKEGGQAQERSTVRPPVGGWKVIWNQMPRRLKEAFWESFAGDGKRTSLPQWISVLGLYQRAIKNGHSSGELIPTEYKQVVHRDNETPLFQMIPLQCENCKKSFNLDTESHENRCKKRDRVLCGACRNMEFNMREREAYITCHNCHKQERQQLCGWIKHVNDEPTLCKDCSKKSGTKQNRPQR